MRQRRPSGWSPSGLNFTPKRRRYDDEFLQPIAMDLCWCGEEKGHDWPGKSEGKPHPRETKP